MTRLSTAGRFWLGYALVLVLAIVGVSSARAAVDSDGFTLCASLWGDCYGSGVWVRRGVGDSFVTYYRPIGSGIQCHASNEYGGGFGDLLDAGGTACYSKAAVAGEAPPPGLGFVDATVGSGFRSPECLGGSVCAEAPDPEPSAVMSADLAGTLLAYAALLGFGVYGFAVGKAP